MQYKNWLPLCLLLAAFIVTGGACVEIYQDTTEKDTEQTEAEAVTPMQMKTAPLQLQHLQETSTGGDSDEGAMFGESATPQDQEGPSASICRQACEQNCEERNCKLNCIEEFRSLCTGAAETRNNCKERCAFIPPFPPPGPGPCIADCDDDFDGTCRPYEDCRDDCEASDYTTCVNNCYTSC